MACSYMDVWIINASDVGGSMWYLNLTSFVPYAWHSNGVRLVELQEKLIMEDTEEIFWCLWLVEQKSSTL